MVQNCHVKIRPRQALCPVVRGRRLRTGVHLPRDLESYRDLQGTYPTGALCLKVKPCITQHGGFLRGPGFGSESANARTKTQDVARRYCSSRGIPEGGRLMN
jgi:hypothetical protein